MTSKTRYRVRYRCRRGACYTRFAVPVRRKRAPTCPSCKGPARCIEDERRRELAAQERCYCNGYPFPHRAGSLRMCDSHPAFAAGIEPTGDEIAQYEYCLQTPRSG